MNIADTSLSIHEVLQTWVRQYAGVAFIAADYRHMWEQAFAKSDVPRVIIVWMGDELRGDFAEAAAMGRVDRMWNVALTRGKSFAVDRNGLTNISQNAKPFYTLVEECRDQIRTLSAVSVEAPVDFRRVTAMQLGEQLVDGYLFEFSTVEDLPEIIYSPDGPPVRVS